MGVASTAVRRALDVVLDGRALNREQARAIYNPDAEPNSLVERVVALRHYGVPTPAIRSLLRQILHVLQLNAQEGGCETEIAGQLDELARALHATETDGALKDAVGYRALARALRAPLAKLRGTDGITYFLAAGAIRRIIETTTVEQLQARSLRNELGDGPHDQLLELLEAVPS